MSISRVSLLVQTTELSLSQISEMLGVTPSHGTSVGEAVSPLSPPSHVRKHTTWALESTEAEDIDLGPHVAEFGSLFERLRSLGDYHLTVNLAVMAYADETGQPLFVGPDVLRYLSGVPCGIAIDMFNELGHHRSSNLLTIRRDS